MFSLVIIVLEKKLLLILMDVILILGFFSLSRYWSFYIREEWISQYTLLTFKIYKDQDFLSDLEAKSEVMTYPASSQ